MRKSKVLGLVGSICLILAMVCSPLMAQSTKAEKPKTVRIGALAQLTGWLGTWDTNQFNVAKVAADMLNEKGGVTVGGQQYKIELVVEDGKSTLDGNTAATNKLIFDHGVKFIIGPSAFFGSAIKGICEQNKIMHILNWCTMQPGEMDASTKWSFLGHDASFEMFLGGVSFLKEKYPKVKKVVLVMPDDGAIPYVGEAGKKILKENGYTVVGNVIGFDNMAVDFNPIAAKVVAAGADAAFHINGLAPALGSTIKGVRELGSNMPFAIAAGADPQAVLTVAGPGTANVFNIGPYNDVPQKTPLLQEITDRIKAKLGAVPISLQFAQGIYEYKQVFEKAQSFDPEAARNTLEKMTTIDTFYGTGRLGGLQSYGIKHGIGHPVPATLLENGKTVFQKWVAVVAP